MEICCRRSSKMPVVSVPKVNRDDCQGDDIFLRALLYLFICYLAGLHKTTAGRGSRKLGGGLGMAQEGIQWLARLQREGAGPTHLPRAGKKKKGRI